jgi:hypothetical protein
MDLHHDTSFRSILEDDYISSTSGARIRSCSGKGEGLWLIIKPFIRLFCIAHFTFNLTLHFRLGWNQASTFSLFTCECGHELDAFSTHLTCCLFRGQRITTHDAIWNIMYAPVWENGHVIWRERWYALTSKISLWVNLYMIQKDQVFIANVVVTNLTWETTIWNVINQPTSAVVKPNVIVKIRKYNGLHEGHHLCRWPWRCTAYSSVIWIVSLENVLIFSMINDQEVIHPCLFTFNFSGNMLVLLFSLL